MHLFFISRPLPSSSRLSVWARWILRKKTTHTRGFPDFLRLEHEIKANDWKRERWEKMSGEGRGVSKILKNKRDEDLNAHEGGSVVRTLAWESVKERRKMTEARRKSEDEKTQEMRDKNKCSTGEQRRCVHWERSYIVLRCCDALITG